MLAAAFACGCALLAVDARPRTVTEAMPAIVQITWEVGLLVCGAVGLVGVGWRGHPATGLGVELGALMLLGSSTAMYGIALFSIAGLQATAAGAFIGAASAGSWWRSAQIVRDLRRIARVSAGGAP